MRMLKSWKCFVYHLVVDNDITPLTVSGRMYHCQSSGQLWVEADEVVDRMFDSFVEAVVAMSIVCTMMVLLRWQQLATCPL
eukprot:1697801-Amphidinium_carterae.1